MYVLHTVLFILALLSKRIGSTLFSVEAANVNPQLRYEACIPTVDCSWFQSDLDVITFLPFKWSPAGYSRYTVDADGRVIALTIADENEIPLITYCLKNLNSLYINESNIDHLPREVKFLSNLNYIGLYRNDNLRQVADEIVELTGLRDLHISQSRQLTHLPGTIGKLSNLRTLLITDGSLEDVPSSIGNLQQLESLDVSSNRLAGLPHNMTGLISLRSLRLGYNRIMSSLQEISTLPNLRHLFIMNLGLKVLPSVIMNMTMLESIDLGANGLTSFSYNIGKLTNLQSLYLGGNQFTKVPVELSLLKNLTTLYMDGNDLTDISNVVLLKQIRHLELSRNQLTSIPSDIGKLGQTLESLYLNDNKLTSLPIELAQMPQLEKLYIRNNLFSTETLEAIKDMFDGNTWTRVYY